MRQRLLILLVTTALAACGEAPVDKSTLGKGPDPSVGSGATVRFDAASHTPGYFRDTFRMLSAQQQIDDATAVQRLLLDLPSRLTTPGELPEMLELEQTTLDSLLILAYRSVQATADTARAARTIGETLLGDTLALDPARDAWNQSHPADEQVAVIAGSASTVADRALWAITQSALGAPGFCTSASASTASWNPGDAEVVWVDEWCEPDQYVGGYCEPDRYIDGDCYEVWMPESCDGGYWEDNGYYEYICYDDDDCFYRWREIWDYVDGYCDGGYYREECDSGYWETGLCYDGTYVPGYCDPGHYEYRFPGGTWSFEQYATAPQECSVVRPSQLAIAVVAAGVLHERLYEDLPSEWQTALDELVAAGKLTAPDESTLAAVQQVLSAVGAGE